jgi:hypothetical protein
VEKVKKKFESVPDMAVRAAAKALKIPKSTVSRIKLKKLGLKGYTKKKVSKYKKDKKIRAKRACLKIY